MEGENGEGVRRLTVLCWHISAEPYGETQLQIYLPALTVRAVALIVSFLLLGLPHLVVKFGISQLFH